VFVSVSKMDVDATQALDLTDDDETDDELLSPQQKRPARAFSDLYVKNVVLANYVGL